MPGKNGTEYFVPLAADSVHRNKTLAPFGPQPAEIVGDVVEQVVRLLFGTSDPPNPVEMTGGVTDRFRLVEEGVGISVVGVPMEALLPVPGVVYRRVADPSPTIEHGLLWFDDHVSPALPAFFELAREVARKNPAPANGRFAIRGLVSS